MEYVRGSNLQELLRANGPFNIGKALDIAIQVLDALYYAHRMQTVHRDIKPANILVDRDGIAKLADFGLAEILTTNAYAGGAGTYAYMAPEDFLEENHSDAQSDIWAVGVTLFEMLTGERPFFAANTRSPFAWKRALETQSPTPLTTLLPGAPQMLTDCLLKAMQRDKEERYLTAGEFLRDMQQVRSELTPEEAKLGLGTVHAGSDSVGEDSEQTADGTRAAQAFQTLPPVGRTEAVNTSAVPLEDMQTVAAVPRKRFTLFNKHAPAVITSSVDSVRFGDVRIGDARTSRITVKISNLTGSARGRIHCTSQWLAISPTEFEGARQSVELIADGVQFARSGEYEDVITVESAAGTLQIPVSVTVIPARKRFSQIALWYVPLFCLAFSPAGIAAMMGTNHPSLSAPAAAATLGLELMLMLVTAAADSGIIERLACIVVSAWMAVVLGIQANSASSVRYSGPLTSGLHYASAAGVCMAGLILVQIGTFRNWKLWAGVVALAGLGIASLCYKVVTGG